METIKESYFKFSNLVRRMQLLNFNNLPESMQTSAFLSKEFLLMLETEIFQAGYTKDVGIDALILILMKCDRGEFSESELSEIDQIISEKYREDNQTNVDATQLMDIVESLMKQYSYQFSVISFHHNPE